MHESISVLKALPSGNTTNKRACKHVRCWLIRKIPYETCISNNSNQPPNKKIAFGSFKHKRVGIHTYIYIYIYIYTHTHTL